MAEMMMAVTMRTLMVATTRTENHNRNHQPRPRRRPRLRPCCVHGHGHGHDGSRDHHHDQTTTSMMMTMVMMITDPLMVMTNHEHDGDGNEGGHQQGESGSHGGWRGFWWLPVVDRALRSLCSQQMRSCQGCGGVVDAVSSFFLDLERRRALPTAVPGGRQIPT